MIYLLGLAVALLVAATYWAATQLHFLMEVRKSAHALDRASRTD